MQYIRQVYLRSLVCLIALIFLIGALVIGIGNKAFLEATICAAVCLGLFAATFRSSLREAGRIERRMKNQRGMPAKLMDAFCVGDTLKVLSVSKNRQFVVFKEFYGVKLVVLPEPADLIVGKHYQLSETGKLLDLMREIMPEEVEYLAGV